MLDRCQWEMLVLFGFRPRDLEREEDVRAAVEAVVGWARAELGWQRRNRPRSSLPEPGVVLAAFGRPARQPSAAETLEALGVRVGGLSVAEVELRLAREVESAERARRFVLQQAGTLPERAGDVLMLALPVVDGQPGQSSGRAVFEPWKLGRGYRPWSWLYGFPEGWETTGPWGDSLGWLREQPLPPPGESCPRCNWFGRWPELVGVDGGRNLEGLVSRAHPNSVAARFPLLSRYASGSGDPLDHLAERGDRACVLCGGSGRLVSLSWGSDPRLRIRPGSQRVGSPALAVVGARGGARLREFARTGVVESVGLRQFLADACFGGSGNTAADREAGFLRRDAIIYALLLEGFEVERVAAAVGLSKTRFYALEVVRRTRAAFARNQEGLVRHWHERGYSVAEIARAVGLARHKVRRIVREQPLRSEASSGGRGSIELLGELLRDAFVYTQVLLRMGVRPVPGPPLEPPDPREWRRGPPIDLYEQQPGMPLHELGEPYHTYVPSAADELGASDELETWSLGVLHPYLLALLARPPSKGGARRKRPARQEASPSAMHADAGGEPSPPPAGHRSR